MGTVLSQTGDTVDLLCWRETGSTDIVEAVLIANPGLAALGPILPDRTEVLIPTTAKPVTETLIRLWGDA